MECLKQAINEIPSLKIDEEFLVKDLFKGYEWNRLAIGERRQLGSVFQNAVKNGELKGTVEMVKKSTSNQQIYIKLKD
ncbi:single-stranded DNA-binding protein [Lysinibacillus sp. M3]|uniref:Single-stranded DNA-binding protein n=1 Tax=Lysinibacillus zambalensis TaxID=3160866 RepID=A0ABV1MYT9_9BACI